MDWPGWNRLPRLVPAKRHLVALEAQWATIAKDYRANSSSEPFGPRGHFFGERLDDVIRELGSGALIWHRRLQTFVDDTAAWRQRMRSDDVWDADETELRCVVGALRAWQYLSPPSAIARAEGRWHMSYLFEAHAGLTEWGSGRQKIDLYHQAASAADPSRDPPLDPSLHSTIHLRRRHLTLLATAKRMETFLAMRRRPQQWLDLAEAFAEAAEYSQQADAVVHVPSDRGVDLHRMWEALMRLRRACRATGIASGRVQPSNCATFLKRERNTKTFSPARTGSAGKLFSACSVRRTAKGSDGSNGRTIRSNPARKASSNGWSRP